MRRLAVPAAMVLACGSERPTRSSSSAAVQSAPASTAAAAASEAAETICRKMEAIGLLEGMYEQKGGAAPRTACLEREAELGKVSAEAARCITSKCGSVDSQMQYHDCFFACRLGDPKIKAHREQEAVERDLALAPTTSEWVALPDEVVPFKLALLASDVPLNFTLTLKKGFKQSEQWLDVAPVWELDRLDPKGPYIGVTVRLEVVWPAKALEVPYYYDKDRIVERTTKNGAPVLLVERENKFLLVDMLIPARDETLHCVAQFPHKIGADTELGKRNFLALQQLCASLAIKE